MIEDRTIRTNEKLARTLREYRTSFSVAFSAPQGKGKSRSPRESRSSTSQPSDALVGALSAYFSTVFEARTRKRQIQRAEVSEQRLKYLLGVEDEKPDRAERGKALVSPRKAAPVAGYSPKKQPKTALEPKGRDVDVDDGRFYKVWFGTNRKATEDRKNFVAEEGETTSLGYVWVWIPKGHKTGETGTSFVRKVLRWDFADDKLAVKSVHMLQEVSFWSHVRALAKREPWKGRTNALLFIHGYNTSFNDAAIRAAQLGYDLKIRGPVAFFAWPSKGTTFGYLADAETIVTSEEPIRRFIVDFVQNSGVDAVHIIAHSMGNRAVLRALKTLESNPPHNFRLGQILLAAPDVLKREFERDASAYSTFGQQTTLYTSRRDVALWFSKFLNQGHRAGYFTPHTVAAGVDTVKVPNFNLELLGHGYFAKAAKLLSDMSDCLRSGTRPDDRLFLDAATVPEGAIWRLQK